MSNHFFRKSLKKFDVFTVAMGCIMLASKVEETLKTLREVLINGYESPLVILTYFLFVQVLYVFHYIYLKRKKLKIKPLELGGQQYTMWKNELITTERYLLKELGFSLYNIMDHPHKYILYFIKLLGGNNELAQCSWNYLNDSLRLDLSLRYEAQVIASAAIFLASLKTRFPLPADLPWWEVMGGDMDSINIICDSILGLYHMPKVRLIVVKFI